MANTYLYNLTTETPLLTDNLIITGGSGHNVDYKALLSAVATLFIESYSGSTLAGSSRSVQSAINAINTNLTNMTAYSRGSLATNSDLNDIYISGVWSLGGSNTYSNMPTGMTYGTLINLNPSSNPTANHSFQVQILVNNTIIAYRFFANSAWYAWHRIFDTVTAKTYTINGVTFSFRRVGRIVTVTSSGTPTVAVATNAYAGNTTIDSDFFPLVAQTLHVAATPSTNMQVGVGTTGNLQYGYAGSQIGTSTNIRVCFSYIAAEY